MPSRPINPLNGLHSRIIRKFLHMMMYDTYHILCATRAPHQPIRKPGARKTSEKIHRISANTRQTASSSSLCLRDKLVLFFNCRPLRKYWICAHSRGWKMNPLGAFNLLAYTCGMRLTTAIARMQKANKKHVKAASLRVSIRSLRGPGHLKKRELNRIPTSKRSGSSLGLILNTRSELFGRLPETEFSTKIMVSSF